jgi:hypothetical protein
MAGVVENRNPFDERELEIVRDCLHEIRDVERPHLFTCLELLFRAIATSKESAIDSAVGRVGDGPIRTCLQKIAAPFVRSLRAALRSGEDLFAVTPKPFVYARSQPSFLGLFSGLSGTVAPTDVWACRTGLYWEKVEPDAFWSVPTGRRGHLPVSLDYRHDPKQHAGMSKKWSLDDDGSLCGEFMIGSHPDAQHWAREAQRGDLGLSMSVRFATRWLERPSPDEWDPVTGTLDMCLRDDASVESVALTPEPTYPSATVERVW